MTRDEGNPAYRGTDRRFTTASKRRISMVPLRLKSRQWIVDENDNIIFGEGRKKILENIEKTGSLNQTAKIMKMSYKGVWSRIKATESYLEEKIVHSNRKEGTRLTKAGKILLEKYSQMKQKCVDADDAIFKDIFG
jgi:molybdate transport system regulatory protein